MLLTKNDILQASNLMSDTWDMDAYSYERNEMYWIQGLINHVSEQEKGNLNYIAFKAVDENGNITAFLTGTAYNESYNGDIVMNVDDMIVDYTQGKRKNAKDVKMLFDQMIAYCKKYDISHWRADSIHESDEARKYTKFLEKQYDGTLSYSFRGRV